MCTTNDAPSEPPHAGGSTVRQHDRHREPPAPNRRREIMHQQYSTAKRSGGTRIIRTLIADLIGAFSLFALVWAGQFSGYVVDFIR